MKATLQSTTKIIDLQTADGQMVQARVWEGTSEGGIPFFALVTRVMVRADQDQTEFERELMERSDPPSFQADKGIPLRMFID